MPGKLHCIRCCTAPSAGPDPTARTTTVYPSPNLHQGRDGNAGSAYLQRSPLSPTSGAAPTHYRFLRCCTLPRQRKRPLTMMAILVHSASHSSMLPGWGGEV